MKVDSQSAGPCRVKLNVKAEAEETRTEYEKVFSEYARHGRIAGFRPGKAPAAIVERHYGPQITAHVRTNLVRQLYPRALEGEKLAVVALVDVQDVLFSTETGISFTLLVDVAPDFKLPKYHKIPIKAEEKTVTDKDVEDRVATLRASLAKYEDAAADAAVNRGDLVSIDYTATSDGKPLAEAAADAAGLAEGKDFWARADEPEFVPGVALALVGMKVGESKEIKVKFEKDHAIEGLRGRKAIYHVTVQRVRTSILPTDAELCERVGMADMAKLAEALRRNLEESTKRAEAQRQRAEIMDFLLKKTEFDLPQSQVAEETQLSMRSMLRDIVSHGGSRDEIEKNRDTILSNATSSAKDRVRLRYILARIAEAESIKVEDEEVQSRLATMADQYGLTPDKLRATIEERHGIEALRADIRAEKTLDFLVTDAKLK